MEIKVTTTEDRREVIRIKDNSQKFGEPVNIPFSHVVPGTFMSTEEMIAKEFKEIVQEHLSMTKVLIWDIDGVTYWLDESLKPVPSLIQDNLVVYFSKKYKQNCQVVYDLLNQQLNPLK